LGTWIPISIGFAMEEASRLYSSREFLVVDDQRITYAQLALRIKQFSRGLLAVGVKPGDRVAWRLPRKRSSPFVKKGWPISRCPRKSISLRTGP